MKWCLTSPGKYYDRGEGLVVYFHPGSGNTHLLSSEATDILRYLEQSPQHPADICNHLGAPAEHVEGIMEELAKVHLVEQT